MLDYYELVDRLERLPVYEAIGSAGNGSELPTQPRTDCTTFTLAYFRQLLGRWTGRYDSVDAQAPAAHVDERADAVLASIEHSEVAVRFVPDWAEESLQDRRVAVTHLARHRSDEAVRAVSSLSGSASAPVSRACRPTSGLRA